MRQRVRAAPSRPTVLLLAVVLGACFQPSETNAIILMNDTGRHLEVSSGDGRAPVDILSEDYKGSGLGEEAGFYTFWPRQDLSFRVDVREPCWEGPLHIVDRETGTEAVVEGLCAGVYSIRLDGDELVARPSG